MFVIEVEVDGKKGWVQERVWLNAPAEVILVLDLARATRYRFEGEAILATTRVDRKNHPTVVKLMEGAV